MKGRERLGIAALGVATVALLLLAGGLTLVGLARREGLRRCRRALASLNADLARLDAYERAEARLASAGSLPSEVPLPVSIPAPSSCDRETAVSPGGWETATFSLRWEAPARTALEALAALCNLGDTWCLRSFSLRPLAGGGAALEARVATARPGGVPDAD